MASRGPARQEIEATGTPPAIAFMRFEEDLLGMRSAGSHGWAGVSNSRYWFDPQADAIGSLMTQSLPFADPRFMASSQYSSRPPIGTCNPDDSPKGIA